MKVIFIVLILFISIFSSAQYPPIPHLPAISPEEAGFNRDSINALDDFISNFEQNDFRGMVVIKDHKIAIEYFYTNTERSDINDIRSAGKSFTALLLGIAINDGLIENIDKSVYSFFSKKKYPNLHKDLKKVKIKHLLNMSSGLDANSDDSSSPGQAGQWIGKDEWYDYLLGIQLVRQPGKKWVYADINSALIGAIIEETSGISLNDYAKKKVFTPLGINKYYWHTNPSNQTVASGTLFLSTLDFAKLGVLVANKGKWGNNQIVPSDYIEKIILTRAMEISHLWSLWDSYGMLWYKNIETIKGRKISYLWASGNGGNQLIIVPKKKMVIALTSTAYGQRYAHSRSRAILNKLLKAID